jgi:hypothetical protein
MRASRPSRYRRGSEARALRSLAHVGPQRVMIWSRRTAASYHTGEQSVVLAPGAGPSLPADHVELHQIATAPETAAGLTWRRSARSAAVSRPESVARRVTKTRHFRRPGRASTDSLLGPRAWLGWRLGHHRHRVAGAAPAVAYQRVGARRLYRGGPPQHATIAFASAPSGSSLSTTPARCAAPGIP